MAIEKLGLKTPEAEYCRAGEGGEGVKPAGKGPGWQYFWESAVLGGAD